MCDRCHPGQPVKRVYKVFGSGGMIMLCDNCLFAEAKEGRV